MAHSSDGGETWTIEPSNTPAPMVYVVSHSNGTGALRPESRFQRVGHQSHREETGGEVRDTPSSRFPLAPPAAYRSPAAYTNAKLPAARRSRGAISAR
jgi:hypothetical protein